MNKIAILETWTETEAGWGTRPDGFSLHIDKEKYKSYVEKYWDSMPDEIQHEYSRPDNNLRVVKVSDELFNKIGESEFGLRYWRSDYSKMIENGELEEIL